MLVRSRALFVFLISVPAASGCTLWYLAGDPYDGVGQGAIASDGATTGDANGADGCVPAGTSTDCETCGHACAGNATCLKNGDAQHCGAAQLQSIIAPVSLAMSGSQVYALDSIGNVWTFPEDIDPSAPLQQLYDSGSTAPQVDQGIAVGRAGIYWTIPDAGVQLSPFDGGAMRITNPDKMARIVAAQGPRIAWTSGDPAQNNGSLHSSLDDKAGIAASGANTINADVENVVLIADGGDVGWTTTDTAHLGAFLADGDASDHAFTPLGSPDAGKVTIRMASDGDNVFLTWGAAKSTSGDLRWLPAGATEFSAPLAGITSNHGAALFAGNGLVYWTDSNNNMSYCDPHDCSNPKQLGFGLAVGKDITAIVASARYIFFSNGANLYRIEPYPP